MFRDMKNTAAQAIGKIPNGYQLRATELGELIELAYSGRTDGVYDALVMAFRYGFILGKRAQKNAPTKK